MKKIISGTELYDNMKKAIELLCDTVAKTLGPIGNNAIIDHSDFSPFITNDGVTIAKNIESDDAMINTILELTKEASIKTDEMVGDGTTTTLVLLKSIFLDGLECIEKGKKPILLKKELEEALEKILSLLKKQSKKPSKEDLLHIAISSANDDAIGNTVYQAMEKVKKKNAIFLTEHDDEKTELCYKKGYQFEALPASSHFFSQKGNIIFDNSICLLIDNELNDINEIALVLNEALEKGKSFVIVANDYSENITNDILSLCFEDKIKCILLKNPEYGVNQKLLLRDLSKIANCDVLTTIDSLNLNHIGRIKHIEIDHKNVVVTFAEDEQIKKYRHTLETEKCLDEEITFREKRLAMLSTGMIEIKIGGIGKTEMREKHMRYEDSLSATNAALNGVLPGSGITLLQIKEMMTPQTDGERILLHSLEKPFIQILENAGLEYQTIYEQIKKNHFQKLYNVKEARYEDVQTTTVLDPLEVVENTIKNATSIASLLLTTNSLIINEYNHEYNKKMDEEL